MKNLKLYSSAETVRYYAALLGLQEAEKYLFEKYIQKDARLLDVGVGGGRTTPWLAARASRYLGIDYSQDMIDECRKKFPALSFQKQDATDLTAFDASDFNVVVFSFNGIDCLESNDARKCCLRSIREILSDHGTFIFSCHNARVLFVPPNYKGANWLRMVWRTVRSSRNLVLIFKQLLRSSFYRGEGYIVDGVHGGHLMHVTTPSHVQRELEAEGFEIVECVSSVHLHNTGQFTTPWYYYVAKKLRIQTPNDPLLQ